MHHVSQGRPSNFQIGGWQQQNFLEKKGAPSKRNLKAKIYICLDIGIYPYIAFTLSGMISIFVSLCTQ